MFYDVMPGLIQNSFLFPRDVFSNLNVQILNQMPICKGHQLHFVFAGPPLNLVNYCNFAYFNSLVDTKT